MAPAGAVVIRPAAIVLLAIALAGAGVALLQSWRLSGWMTRAQTAEQRLTAWAEAARIRAEHDRRMIRLQQEAALLDHQLAKEEGGDVPLSDYLRDAAGRLWP